MYIDVLSFLADYGWYVLITGIISAYIYNKSIKHKLENYWKTKDEQEYAAKYHKNPDLFNARMKAQEDRTKKMQEEYNKQLEEYKRKQEEKEAKKREELLAAYDKKDGHRLGNANDKFETTKTTFKPEYNPLMGGASGSNYRPPRRSACGGGGCGR